MNSIITPGESLLFFDEIQECPNAIKSLRYFYEELPELHVIAAGSLIEFTLKDISFPVGRIRLLNMYPMNFEEFLLASDKHVLLSKLRSDNKEKPKHLIDNINKELYTYFIVGGMPEAENRYIETNSFIEVRQVQEDLISTFRQDFSKYASRSNKRCLNSVLSSVAQRVGEQIQYSKLTDEFTNPTIKKAFDFLEMARLFTRVTATSAEGLPLGSKLNNKRFKAVFLDIGLLSYKNGYSSNKILSKQDQHSAFRGAMAEQFIGQELLVSTKKSLYYWKREKSGSSAELDYLIERNGHIIPIEVKSGKAGKLRSLHLFMNKYPSISRAMIFTADKYGEMKTERLKFLPLFEVGFWCGA